MRSQRLILLSVASLLMTTMQVRAAEQAQASLGAAGANKNVLDYTTSWIGNTLPGDGTGAAHALRHVALDIDGIYATPDGKIYTNTTWDEGGRPVSVFKDGKLISPLNNLNNSPNYSNGGGSSIAADATHVFKSDTPNGTGVSILNAATLDTTTLSLTGSSTLNDSHGVEGMAIHNGSLYLTQQDFNKVEVYSLKTLALTNTIAVNNPVSIAIDSRGGLWISHRDQTPYLNLNGNIYDYYAQLGLPTVDHYSATGTYLNSVTLPGDGEVGALSIDNFGYLLVGDNGPDENIKVYGNLLKDPVLVTELGAKGGVYAGGVDERGKTGPWRFRGITGIASDAVGNIYVSENGFAGYGHANGHGSRLRAYDVFGASAWSVEALEFVDTLDVDPTSETDIYDPYHHFKVDYNRPAGSEAQYFAETYNPYLYPDDVRITGIPNTTQIQYVQGHKLMLLGNQGGVYMAIYRYDDSPSGPGKEIGIPCGAFDYGSFQGNYQDFVVQPLNGEFIWRDLNGDGLMQTDEFFEPTNDLHRDGGAFWMDANGDVWQVNYQGEFPPYESSIHLRRYILQGFDHFGAPMYDFKHIKTYDVPVDFPGTVAVQRAVFYPHESDGGTLYIGANSPSTGAFSQIIRYDNWDKGNRAAKWTINVPYDPDPDNTWSPVSFSKGGRFLYVDFNTPHYTVIYSSQNGEYVGEFTPGANVGGLPNVGNDDEWQSTRAFRRKNGEEILLHEEDYQAKQLMYRWTPPSTLAPPPVPAVPVLQSATGGDQTATITWTASPGALIYNVSRSASKSGPYTLVDAGVVGNTVNDSPLVNGQTYYYEVSALTVPGASASSASIAVAPVPAGTTYEASAGVLAGSAQLYTCPLCSNGEQVGSLVPGATDTLSGITVPTTGTYPVRIYYENGDSTPTDTSYINLVINGTTTLTSPDLTFTGSYGTPGYVTINVSLNKGSNIIVLGNPASDPNGAPNVDRIVVAFKPI